MLWFYLLSALYGKLKTYDLYTTEDYTEDKSTEIESTVIKKPGIFKAKYDFRGGSLYCHPVQEFDPIFLLIHAFKAQNKINTLDSSKRKSLVKKTLRKFKRASVIGVLVTNTYLKDFNDINPKFSIELLHPQESVLINLNDKFQCINNPLKFYLPVTGFSTVKSTKNAPSVIKPKRHFTENIIQKRKKRIGRVSDFPSEEFKRAPIIENNTNYLGAKLKIKIPLRYYEK